MEYAKEELGQAIDEATEKVKTLSDAASTFASDANFITGVGAGAGAGAGETSIETVQAELERPATLFHNSSTQQFIKRSGQHQQEQE